MSAVVPAASDSFLYTPKMVPVDTLQSCKQTKSGLSVMQANKRNQGFLSCKQKSEQPLRKAGIVSIDR